LEALRWIERDAGRAFAEIGMPHIAAANARLDPSGPS
jgi:hypothetical protein